MKKKIPLQKIETPKPQQVDMKQRLQSRQMRKTRLRTGGAARKGVGLLDA